MKKNILLSLLAIMSLAACKQTEAGNTAATAGVATTMVDSAHNSFNSLDWSGMYKGVLPCADCEGIETILVLNADGSYLLRTTYLGQPDTKATEKTGSLTWNAERNTVILGGIENGPNQYFVGENKLVQLDMAGKKITGQLAEKYVLVKQ